MTLQLTTRRIAVAVAVVLVCVLYLADLSGMGLVSKDEPRYADIGRAMAHTGDWITPRLWGHPWLEKPPLLYWLIGAGFQSGFGPEVAPRLPVALLSLAFLWFFHDRVRKIWDRRVADFSTAILATAAGWLAYSHVAVTDIPMAACFSVAVLFAVSAGEKERSSEYVLAAGALALAVLGKSLVPLVLFAPVAVVDYRRLREWLRPAPVAAFLVIALPWHILCTVRNGAELWNVLFVQQQFGRFFSPERQHVQPWWFYLPVLLLLLFPWFPLLAVVDRDWRDRRTRLLGAVVIFGFLFFSKSVNKLPGYLLPLLPSVCILIGRGLARTKRMGLAMILPATLLGAIPVAAHVLPYALATGLRSRPFPWGELAMWSGGAAVAAILLALLLKQRSFPVVAAASALLCLALQFAAFPAIDRAVSARSLWRERHPSCVPSPDRALQYGLNYYAGRELPECAVLDQSRLKVVR